LLFAFQGQTLVRNGHESVGPLPYRADAGVPPGIEVIDFARLLVRAAGHGVDPYSPKRLEFHLLIAVRSGTLRSSLDFTDHELGPGDWLWARPGQVHRYASDPGQAEGRLVLFVPGFLDRATAEAAGADRGAGMPAVVSEPGDRHALALMLPVLEAEYQRWLEQSTPLRQLVLRHLVAALVLRLADRRQSLAGPGAGATAFLRFQAAVEQEFTRSHHVEDYAARLGYSVRTLTRATQAAVGCGAKRFVDDRVLLEAKRLLVHTTLPATSIGAQLGFPDATAFAKFFRQRTRRTPTEFRSAGA
jgi:AraC-like DNA-binding protein